MRHTIVLDQRAAFDLLSRECIVPSLDTVVRSYEHTAIHGREYE